MAYDGMLPFRGPLAYPYAIAVSPDAKSGDGTVANVGVKLTGSFCCQECNQRFSSDRALMTHVKFTHSNKVSRVCILHRDGDAIHGMTMGGDKLFQVDKFSTNVGELKDQIADALRFIATEGQKAQAHAMFLSLVEGANCLGDDDVVSDVRATIVKQDMGYSAEEFYDR